MNRDQSLIWEVVPDVFINRLRQQVALLFANFGKVIVATIFRVEAGARFLTSFDRDVRQDGQDVRHVDGAQAEREVGTS